MATSFTGAGLPMTADGLRSGCDKLAVKPAEIWTVLAVETLGSGFLPDRRPKILFERHIFHKETKGVFDQTAPDLSNPDQGGYSGGAAEYPRLLRAMELNEQAALRSTSWGIGQIMGFNAAVAGFPDAAAMVQAMVNSEDQQVAGLFAFLTSSNLDQPLRDHDWKGFAEGYNGSSYAKNQYDQHLESAFEKYSTGTLPDLTLRAAQLYLTYLGYKTGPVDGALGHMTRSALMLFQQAQGIDPTGELDDTTWTRLQQGGAAAAAATP
jgi:N-acetylmuramidase-like protein/putative peptidoglycan binding protein